MDNYITGLQKKWSQLMNPNGKEKTVCIVNYDDPATKCPLPYREFYDDRVEWFADNYLRQMDRMSWLRDDSIPHIWILTGTEIFAESFGCNVHYSYDNMPFALPMLNSVNEITKLKVPKVADSVLMEQFEFLHRVRQKVGDDNLYSLPDIQSPVDIGALVFEKSEFLIAMLEEPEAIHELSLKTEELLTEFLDLWFKEFGTKYIAHYPKYYMEGGFTFSEDEVGEFSSEMFEEFCLDGINRLSDRYGGCGMHCCANSHHQWESFKKIKGLRFINLNQPQEIIDNSIKKLGTDYVHWHMYGPNEVPEVLHPAGWVKNAPSDARIVLEEFANSREDAIERLKRLREIENSRA